MTTEFVGIYIIKFLIGLYFLIMGILKFIEHERGGKLCPICNYDHMIEKDDPEALKLIKQYDLKPGKNPKARSSPEHNFNPFETPKS